MSLLGASSGHNPVNECQKGICSTAHRQPSRAQLWRKLKPEQVGGWKLLPAAAAAGSDCCQSIVSRNYRQQLHIKHSKRSFHNKAAAAHHTVSPSLSKALALPV